MKIDIRVLDLLCARLCHELVSPVGAINNGVELLGEDDPEFVKDAMTLIGQSARKAGQRLQFYRFAYGASTGMMNAAAATNGRDLTLGLLEGGKVACDWPTDAPALDLDWQKLACNMLVLAAESLPRGGRIALRAGAGGTSGVEVAATGDSVSLLPEVRDAIGQAIAVDALTSRGIHAYYTSLLAGTLGARFDLAVVEPGHALFTARVAP